MQSCEQGALCLQGWVVPNSKTSKYRVRSLKTAVVSKPPTLCCLLRFLSPSRYPDGARPRAYADGAGLGCTAHSGPSTAGSRGAGFVVAGSSALRWLPERFSHCSWNLGWAQPLNCGLKYRDTSSISQLLCSCVCPSLGTVVTVQQCHGRNTECLPSANSTEQKRLLSVRTIARGLRRGVEVDEIVKTMTWISVSLSRTQVCGRVGLFV